jgi:hypothetical protein
VSLWLASRGRALVFLCPLLVLVSGCAATADDDGDLDEGAGVKDAAVVESIYTVDGWMSLEDAYVPRVCTQENGAADFEALKAQAVAARTYLLRAMRDDTSLGTTSNPVGNGEHFQAYAKTANQGCIDAAQQTRGMVGKYQGQIVIGNYVAGSSVNADGSLGNDYSSTEKWVTYNEGKTGSNVTPTKLSYTARSDNRGCMGQNRADWLSRQGYGFVDILRYFYGADLEVGSVDGGSTGGGSGSGDACGGITYQGQCAGSVVSWCENGALQSYDCANKAQTCGWQDDSVGNNCVAAPVSSCESLGYAGACDGAVLSWCENGEVKSYDCAAGGQSCGWQSDDIGNNCL